RHRRAGRAREPAMSAQGLAAHLVVLLLAPIVLVGIVNRTKSVWAGRKGVPLLQVAFDLQRLLRKRPVYSAATTSLVRIAPWIVLATTAVTGLLVPLAGSQGPLSFPYDFVFFAYAWGLG